MALVPESEGSLSCVNRQRPDYDYMPIVNCGCGVRSPRWYSWTWTNPGRRFNRCRRRDEDGGCGFFEFFDPPIPEEAAVVIRGLCQRERELYQIIQELRTEKREWRAKEEAFNGMAEEVLCQNDEKRKLTKKLRKMKMNVYEKQQFIADMAPVRGNISQYVAVYEGLVEETRTNLITLEVMLRQMEDLKEKARIDEDDGFSVVFHAGTAITNLEVAIGQQQSTLGSLERKITAARLGATALDRASHAVALIPLEDY